MIDIPVALYDYEGSLLEKNGDETIIMDFDQEADHHIKIGRDWGDEPDLNAPYVVAWHTPTGVDGEAFIVRHNAMD